MEALEKKCTRLKIDENWIGKLFEKKFHYELDEEYKDLFTLEERREQLIRMYDGSKNRPQSLQSALLLEILENGMKLDIYDKKYFLEYLKHPLRQNWMNVEKVKNDIFSYNWNNYLCNIQCRNNNGNYNYEYEKDKKMFNTYLEQFYLEKGNLKEFEKYFDPNFFKEQVLEFEFYTGKDLNTESLNAQKFETLKDKVLIELLDCNKEVFKKEDRVQIVAELKNTPQLYVKVYEFDRKTEFSGCR